MRLFRLCLLSFAFLYRSDHIAVAPPFRLSRSSIPIIVARTKSSKSLPSSVRNSMRPTLLLLWLKRVLAVWVYVAITNSLGEERSKSLNTLLSLKELYQSVTPDTSIGKKLPAPNKPPPCNSKHIFLSYKPLRGDFSPVMTRCGLRVSEDDEHAASHAGDFRGGDDPAVARLGVEVQNWGPEEGVFFVDVEER